jgi:hypothetical protein
MIYQPHMIGGTSTTKRGEAGVHVTAPLRSEDRRDTEQGPWFQSPISSKVGLSGVAQPSGTHLIGLSGAS